MNNTFSFLYACAATGTLLLSGCASIPPDHQLKTGYLTPTKNTPAKKIYLKEPVSCSYTQKIGGAIIKFNSTSNLTLEPGEYIEIARDNGATYYRHVGKGLTQVELGISSHYPGGIKVPNDFSGQWRAWIYYSMTKISGNTMETISNPNMTNEFLIENLSQKIKLAQ